MKVIIAGSRGIEDYEIIRQAIKSSGFLITEVVSGTARGVDILGEKYANESSIPIKKFPAQWNRQPDGSYDKAAGHKRNKKMAEYADALIAVWDGISPGTKSMIKYANDLNLKVYVYEV